MSNLTLYIVDATQAPLLTTPESGLQALMAQLPPLGERANAHVLLLGYDQAQLIDWHRALFQYGIKPSHCHTLLPDSADMLRDIDPVLPTQVCQHMIDALAPAHIIEVASGKVTQPDSADALEAAPLPTLAFISPLPPQATGIASYSAELLPYLAEHFTITLVVDQPEVDAELSAFECIDPATFSQRADEFAYTLYQVGNSLYHAFQFGLLRRHPGMVVLHDYFLFDAVWWLEESGLRPNAVCERLYADHGYPALIDHARASDRERGAEQYPVNGLVTQYAGGIIYHSEHARTLAHLWGQGEQPPTYHIPHLRKLPARTERTQARKTLNIREDALVIASFGGINPKKLTHVLVEAFLDAAPENAQLVLVGAQHGGEYGRALECTIKRHPQGQRVTVTGYVSRDTYTAWLHAADIAVQLRTQSRGETSGAVFDAMAHGVAVISNAHGSNIELPEHSAYLLPDHEAPTALAKVLAQALTALSGDAARREQLATAGRDYVATTLAPARIAAQYRDAIIEAPCHSPRYRYERYLDQLAANPALRQAAHKPDEAKCLTYRLSEADTTPTEHQPRLLIDVSTIAWEDLKTGIERVTRRISDHLLRHPPNGWRVELIRWGGDDFYLARGFACDQLGLEVSPGPDTPVEARPGDYYASLEWAPPLLKQAGHVMQRMRANGVRFYFTVHDLLPLSLPECFPAHVPATMREWFNAISELADGIMCVSQHVADTVEAELSAQQRQSQHRPWVKHFHLGADFQRQDAPTALLTKVERQQLAPLEQRNGPVLLMVGTIEPRKGHRQVLDALEQCWAEDTPLNLVLVGKQGWDVDALIARLQCHPARQKRLFWFTNASDALLNTLYQQSDALVAASYGEGFGLPLIEAAHHGIAILARDIPVFREVAGEYADYFKADTPEALASALKQWGERWQQGRTVSSNGMPFLSWQQSAEHWVAALVHDEPAHDEPTAKEPT